MALCEMSENAEKKSVDPHKKEKQLMKVIIRRLPPSMDQETFLNQVSPVPSYDYFYMVKGDASLGENSFSRAYINFTNPNDIYDFKEKFDNYVFLDTAGHEYPAVVEFAAFQKIPKRRNKVRVDPKMGSIDSDPYYLEFIEMLNKPLEQDEKPEYTYQITDNKNDGNESTPLLDFIKNKRVEKMRIREERREERKRKEFERKKFRDDERKKRFEEKSPIKSSKPQYSRTSPKEKSGDTEKVDDPEKNKKTPEEKTPEKEEPEKFEKPQSSYYKNREKKFDDKKKDFKSKYPPKKEYLDKREFKNRRDDYKDREYNRNKHEEYRKDDPKNFQKKVKKYSEKREERKIEAQKKLEQQQQESVGKGDDNKDVTEKFRQEGHTPSGDGDKETSSKGPDESRNRDNDSQSQKRIRNKDRPTIAIYRPGMLSKRKQVDGDSDGKKE